MDSACRAQSQRPPLRAVTTPFYRAGLMHIARSPEFADAVKRCRPDQIVIDLVRLPLYGSAVVADYRGICW